MEGGRTHDQQERVPHFGRLDLALRTATIDFLMGVPAGQAGALLVNNPDLAVRPRPRPIYQSDPDHKPEWLLAVLAGEDQ